MPNCEAAEALPADQARQVVHVGTGRWCAAGRARTRARSRRRCGRCHPLVVVGGAGAHVDVRVDESHDRLQSSGARQWRAIPVSRPPRAASASAGAKSSSAFAPASSRWRARAPPPASRSGAPLEQARENRRARHCGEWADAAPQLRAHRRRRRPALVRVVTEHPRQRRIGPRIEPGDQVEARPDEQRLENHLVPRRTRRSGSAG